MYLVRTFTPSVVPGLCSAELNFTHPRPVSCAARFQHPAPIIHHSSSSSTIQHGFGGTIRDSLQSTKTSHPHMASNSSTSASWTSPGAGITGGYDGNSETLRTFIVFFAGLAMYNSCE